MSPERRQQMLDLVNRDGSAQVDQLAQAFAVSRVTVRGDLDWLAERNLVRRARGGAVAVLAHTSAMAFTERTALNSAEKKLIARAARQLVQPNETIILDAGTTVLELAVLLGDADGLTVVTPALDTAVHVERFGTARIVLVGGEFDPRARSVMGAIAEADVAELPAHRAFLAAHAIDTQQDIADLSFDVARLKRAIVSAAREVILLADSSKWSDCEALAKVVSLSDIDILVTDSGLPEALRDQIASLGTRVIVA
jgi:DeoR family transcriptional regulator of aga operon